MAKPKDLKVPTAADFLATVPPRGEFRLKMAKELMGKEMTQAELKRQCRVVSAAAKALDYFTEDELEAFASRKRGGQIVRKD